MLQVEILETAELLESSGSNYNGVERGLQRGAVKIDGSADHVGTGVGGYVGGGGGLDIGGQLARWQELMERQDVESCEDLAKMLLDSW